MIFDVLSVTHSARHCLGVRVKQHYINKNASLTNRSTPDKTLSARNLPYATQYAGYFPKEFIAEDRIPCSA